MGLALGAALGLIGYAAYAQRTRYRRLPGVW